MEKTILHCDLNNFYASVEQKLHPEYDGLPIAVSGNPKLRNGIVLAKNQLAKECGVETAEAIWISRQKCPNIIFLPPHFEEYVKYSNIIFNIYTEFTDKVESFGLDECWLDVTESISLFGDGKTIADKIRQTVKKRTGLTISVGVSFTKYLAKLGSDLKKPDATTVLNRETYMDKIKDLPPGILMMVGRHTEAKLKLLNIHTVYQLSITDREMLRSHIGILADNIINSACGIETETVKKYYDRAIPKSISKGTTPPRDIKTLEDAKIVIYALSEIIAHKLRSYNFLTNAISLSIKDTNFQSLTRQKTLRLSTSNASDIAETAIQTLEQEHNFAVPLRAITVGAIRLCPKHEGQLSLFSQPNDREEQLEESVDILRKKYGFNAVKRCILLKNDLIVNLHEEDNFEPFKRN